MDPKTRTENGSGKNEGEGSKTADRQYRKEVDEFLKHADPDQLGRQAASEIARDRPGYRDAEEQGKRRAAEEDPELYRKGPSTLPNIEPDVPPAKH